MNDLFDPIREAVNEHYHGGEDALVEYVNEAIDKAEAALPAIEAELRERLAVELERQATDAAARQIPDLIVRTLEEAADLCRAFPTQQEPDMDTLSSDPERPNKSAITPTQQEGSDAPPGCPIHPYGPDAHCPECSTDQQEDTQ